MGSIHLVCRDRLNLNRAATPDAWESGFWDIPKDQAAQLVGGMIYLHQKKSDRSYFGGRIDGFQEVETNLAHGGRIVFAFTFSGEARDARWRGGDHPRAWSSGVVND
jgi:hypothetical protein